MAFIFLAGDLPKEHCYHLPYQEKKQGTQLWKQVGKSLKKLAPSTRGAFAHAVLIVQTNDASPPLRPEVPLLVLERTTPVFKNLDSGPPRHTLFLLLPRFLFDLSSSPCLRGSHWGEAWGA